MNCEPLVSGPSLPIERQPKPLCLPSSDSARARNHRFGLLSARRAYKFTKAPHKIVPLRKTLRALNCSGRTRTIRKTLAVDALAAAAVAVGEVAALADEAWDDAVQHGSAEGQRLAALAVAPLACAQRPEIIRGPRHGVGKQLEGEPQDRAGATDRYVEVHNRVGHDAVELVVGAFLAATQQWRDGLG
jgi:hypothetical protein